MNKIRTATRVMHVDGSARGLTCICSCLFLLPTSTLDSSLEHLRSVTILFVIYLVLYDAVRPEITAGHSHRIFKSPLALTTLISSFTLMLTSTTTIATAPYCARHPTFYSLQTGSSRKNGMDEGHHRLSTTSAS